MSRDPEGGRDAEHPMDRDSDETQAYTPTFGDRDPIAPVPGRQSGGGPEWSAESLLPLASSETETEAPAPAAKPSTEPTALDLLFGGDRFEEAGSPPNPGISAGISVRRRGATEAGPVAPERVPDRMQRILLAVLGGLLAVLLLVGLYVLGTRLPAVLAAQPDIDVSAMPLPSPTGPAGPLPPGVHAWNALRGGECLEPFTGAWAEEFTVVPCDEQHSAQLTFRGSYRPVAENGETAPPLPPFPGAMELAAGIDSLCSAPGTIDLDAAADITDGQVQGAFPVTEEQWAADPSYFCFFSRSSGGSLTGSVAAG